MLECPTSVERLVRFSPFWRAGAHLTLGIEHILTGIDHLLFVLCLLILVDGWRRLVTTVSAFTVAHSLTLGAATLGLATVPQAPVEAVIALSIVFVAGEIVHGVRGRPGITARAPWAIAFVFGLLHGFGFAGALLEAGLPDNAVPLALLFFNLGVEVGQLAFVVLVLVALQAWRRLPLRAPAWTSAAVAYLVGSVAMYWTIERTIG
jgi:hydrogenase/urease accessory protein HupE